MLRTCTGWWNGGFDSSLDSPTGLDSSVKQVRLCERHIYIYLSPYLYNILPDCVAEQDERQGIASPRTRLVCCGIHLFPRSSVPSKRLPSSLNFLSSPPKQNFKPDPYSGLIIAPPLFPPASSRFPSARYVNQKTISTSVFTPRPPELQTPPSVIVMSSSGGQHVHRPPANRPSQGRGAAPAFGGPALSGIPVPSPPAPSEVGSGVSDVRKRQSKKDEVCP